MGKNECKKHYKRIGVVVNRPKDKGYLCTLRVVKRLVACGFEALLAQDICDEIGIGTCVNELDLYKESEFIICLGGDGTFLKTARQTLGLRIPVLGINMGTVGFLAEVEIADIESAVDLLADGNVGIQPRMALRAEVFRNEKLVFKGFAVNDAVVTRMALSRIVDLHVSVDGKYVDAFPSDGLIIATPTGSTAYSLSAGGPIIQPEIPLMVITPICPHILYSRSFIVSRESLLDVHIGEERNADAMLTVDGQEGFELKMGDHVMVGCAKEEFLFASLGQVNFFEVLRAKIHNRNTLSNDRK